MGGVWGDGLRGLGFERLGKRFGKEIRENLYIKYVMANHLLAYIRRATTISV